MNNELHVIVIAQLTNKSLIDEGWVVGMHVRRTYSGLCYDGKLFDLGYTDGVDAYSDRQHALAELKVRGSGLEGVTFAVVSYVKDSVSVQEGDQ